MSNIELQIIEQPIEIEVTEQRIELKVSGLFYQGQGGGGGDLANYYTKSQINALPVSTFDNDAGYLDTHQDISGKADISSLATVATSGSYHDLSDAPVAVSAFSNDAGYLTQHQSLANYYNKTEVDSALLTKQNLLNAPDNAGKILNGKLQWVDMPSGGGGGVSLQDVKNEIGLNLIVRGGGYMINTSSNGITIGRLSQVSAHSNTVAIGANSRCQGGESTAIGYDARANSNSCVTVGYSAWASGSGGVSIGRSANTSTYIFAMALGIQSTVTGNNQNQIGSSGTTTYCYGAVQDRSDVRDKTDIQDCELGLDFVNALRPVKYKWDYREDYFNEMFSQPSREHYFSESDYLSAKEAINQDDFESAEEYQLAIDSIDPQDFVDVKAYELALEQYALSRAAFFANPVKDGSKTRNRYHHGLIAQEFKATLDNLGIDHAAYQDHSQHGGLDVRSIGYTELIPNLIKAIQELTAKVEALGNS